MPIPTVWIYWVACRTIVTCASAYIVKGSTEYGFAALTAFYTIYKDHRSLMGRLSHLSEPGMSIYSPG